MGLSGWPSSPLRWLRWGRGKLNPIGNHGVRRPSSSPMASRLRAGIDFDPHSFVEAMEFNAGRVFANVRSADTEDLLDRVTAFREGMEPQALAIIENELARRGLGPREIESYWEPRRAETIFQPDGIAA